MFLRRRSCRTIKYERSKRKYNYFANRFVLLLQNKMITKPNKGKKNNYVVTRVFEISIKDDGKILFFNVGPTASNNLKQIRFDLMYFIII